MKEKKKNIKIDDYRIIFEKYDSIDIWELYFDNKDIPKVCFKMRLNQDEFIEFKNFINSIEVTK